MTSEGGGYAITGRVIDPLSGEGVPDLLLRAYDEQRILGQTSTDEHGDFEISLAFSAEEFAEFLAGQRPARITMHKGDEVLGEHHTSGTWDPNDRLFETIELVWSPTPPGEAGGGRADGVATAERVVRYALARASGSKPSAAADAAGISHTTARRYEQIHDMQRLQAKLASAASRPAPAATTRAGASDTEDRERARFEELLSFLPIPGTPGVAVDPAPGGSSSLKQAATDAIAGVLGRRLSDDPQEFLTALRRAFVPQQVDGKVAYIYTRQSVVAASDLGGRLSGAQASFFRRYQRALDDMLPLLDGLVPAPLADEQRARAMCAIVRAELQTLGAELGRAGGWRQPQVKRLFRSLEGDVARLAQAFGFDDAGGITVEDEQNRTDLQVVQDYIVGLASNFRDESAAARPFLGTQLVLLSRALAVLPESVDAIRRAMQAIGLGPNERSAAQLHLPDDTRMSVEDLLSLADDFKAEAEALIQHSGRLGVSTIVPFAREIAGLVDAALEADAPQPSALHSPQVRRLLGDLAEQLASVAALALELQDGTAVESARR